MDTLISTENNRKTKLEQRQQLAAQVLQINDIAAKIFTALSNSHGFSLIRLGDGELLLLAQDLVFPTTTEITAWGALMATLCDDPQLGEGDDEVSRWGYVLRCAGVGYPDPAAQQYLITALKTATVIGIPTTYRPGRSTAHLRLVEGFQTVFLEILNKLALPLTKLQLTDSAAHYALYAAGCLNRLVLPDHYPEVCKQYNLAPNYRPRILLIGNRAADFSRLLADAGCNIAGVISPVNTGNIADVIAKLELQHFDIALVSAGVAAKYLCTLISEQYNKIAIDTGRLFDLIAYDYGHLDYTVFEIPFNLVL